ncbi:MAG TPA: hypothetical protein VH280_07215 [Verrucomicrobiae bacterium]|nr:hypothetical protein [Verrucomicrobiae bacterium]
MGTVSDDPPNPSGPIISVAEGMVGHDVPAVTARAAGECEAIRSAHHRAVGK